jgi:hypothetical protein
MSMCPKRWPNSSARISSVLAKVVAPWHQSLQPVLVTLILRLRGNEMRFGSHRFYPFKAGLTHVAVAYSPAGNPISLKR